MDSILKSHTRQPYGAFISLALASVGRTEQVERLFDSLLAQTSNAFEVILADQNQDDRLVPSVQNAVSQGMNITHVRLEKPDQYAARTIGIEKAKGQYIAFPDDDCWYEPETIEEAIHLFETKNVDGLIAQWRESRRVSKNAADVIEKELEWKDICGFRTDGASMITQFYKTSVVRAIGGFDKRMGLGCWFGGGEDTDMFFAVVRKGFKVMMAPTVVVRHRFDTSPNPHPNLVNIRVRARGTGALYAKHHVPLWIIIRGFVSPLAHPVLKLQLNRPRLAIAFAQTRGRVEGFFKWKFGQK